MGVTRPTPSTHFVSREWHNSEADISCPTCNKDGEPA